MNVCKCGARIARGRFLRWVHVDKPSGWRPPHYAIPASREAVVRTPRTTASPAAGRSGIRSGGH